MTVPVMTYTFAIVGLVVFIFLLIVVVYARVLIFIALIVLGLLYVKYRREQKLKEVTS